MEETEQSSSYMNDLEEDFRTIEEDVADDSLIKKHISNSAEQSCSTSCGCYEKNFCGKICECNTIKEDIRTLFFLGEFVDNLIAGQKKALKIPLEQAKLYKMLDVAFEMKLQFGDCSCEQDEESDDSENGQLTQKNEPPFDCHCGSLPQKRCVLRIIRNDIYQRTKLVKKLDYLLIEKNKKIIEIIKKREKSDPCSPYETRSISYDETSHKLIERYLLLKKMKEGDIPTACLFDKKGLMEHIGLHRILTKPLRYIYLMEELADQIRIKMEKDQNSDKCYKLDESVENIKCICPEINKRIEAIKSFKNMISRLNPIVNRKEEPLDISKSRSNTIDQLINARQKKDKQKLADILHKRTVNVQLLMEQHIQIEDKRMLTNVIEMLMAYLKKLEAVLKSHEKSEASEGIAEVTECRLASDKAVTQLIAEKKELKKLASLLKKYKNRGKEPLDDEESLLESINEMLQKYLEKQKTYCDKMEKIIPGFKSAIFDHEQKKHKIVAEICTDPGEKNSASKTDVKSEPHGRKRMRKLLKGLTKPYLHNTDVSSLSNELRNSSNGNNKQKLINGLTKIKKQIDNKLDNEVSNECNFSFHFMHIESEDIEGSDLPLNKIADDSSQTVNYGEIIKMKLKNVAFEEGRKIVSQPDPVTPKQMNLIWRKRLLHELGLKCKKEGHCCTEKLEPTKIMLKAAYETEKIKDCKCTCRLKKLYKLENDFENIILHPEKYHIDYVSGPLKFINADAIKRVRAFIHKHAKKKHIFSESDSDFIESLSKRKLATKYDDTRFSVVWNDFERDGLFSINLEAQMMTNERIIIRPQYQKRVKVLSGGRVGLDPLYAEYVCMGMLDGVVLGNEKNGPIPRTILQAIKEVDTGEGVIIIILNEPEERLSFLFAIERARKLGIDAELVLARDDISEHQPEKLRYGCRGHTGIILQFKIAAGMAAKGYNLSAIARMTQGIQVATLDCYMSKYGLFIGCGIRNDEKGYYAPVQQGEDILSELLKQLMDPGGQHSIVPEPDTNMILLINKSRICQDDVYSMISYISRRIIETGAKVGRAYHGNFSAFTKQGFSITLAKDWNDELIKFLDFPTTCVHWPPHLSGSRDFIMNRTRSHREPIIGAYIPSENVQILFEIMDRTLREIAQIITLDRVLEYCRTTGVALLNVIWILKPNLKRLPLDRPYLFLCLVGQVLNVNLPSIGSHFQMVLVVAAQEFIKDPNFIVSWRNWCMALIKGTQSFAAYTKFRVGDGTILDYLIPITDSICDIREGWSPIPFLFGGLEKVHYLEEERKNDLGIIILHQLFRAIYTCLNEFAGHYSNEDWWKIRPSPQILLVNQSCKETICPDGIPEDVKELIKEKEKEWLEYPSPASTVYSVKDDIGTQPSIEAGYLEEAEGDAISLRSAAGLLFEQLQSEKKTAEEISEHSQTEVASSKQEVSELSNVSHKTSE